jgi:hypothetical protein
MPTSHTPLLGLAQPQTGELTGTWGDVVNQSITALVEQAIAGATTISTDADVVLTTSAGVANQARSMMVVLTGARTAARTITAPAQSKLYIVANKTSGGYAVTFRGVGPTTGVSVPAGAVAVLAWTGSDFEDIMDRALKTSGGTMTGAVFENRVTMGAGTAIAVNTGAVFTKTITAATTFTVSGTPPAGVVASFLLDLTNAGAFTITWWSGVKWPGGSPPSLSAAGRDVVGFFTYDGGTTWTGLLVGRDIR